MTKSFMRCLGSWILVFSALIVLSVCEAGAQIAGTGSIQGEVTDSTGAVIQGASVAATNTATNVQHKTTTDSSGLYSMPNLEIGVYTIQISAPSFGDYRQSNVVLEVGSSIAVNAKLNVGSATQTVVVSTSTIELQKEDTTFKQTIDQKTVTEMPLNGRNMTDLIPLAGGAVNANENNDVSSSKGFPTSAVVSIAGGQGNATDYRLDGGDHNDYMTNINLPFPFPDAVAEFSVETTAQGAQSGLHPGGLVNVVTRSGTNQWHGAAFEFLRNNYINSKTFFSSGKDVLHRHQFGGTIGGPILQNRFFAFAGYQRTHQTQLYPNTLALIPTQQELMTKNFSDCDNPATNPLVDPHSGTALAGNVYTGAYSPAALAIMAEMPASTSCAGVSFAIPNDYNENQFITREDFTINSKHNLYGRYLLDGYDQPAFYSPTDILLTTQPGVDARVQGLTVGENWLISDKLVNSFHVTGTRRAVFRAPAAGGPSPTTLGINNGGSNTPGVQLTVNGKWGIYCGKCSDATFNVNTYAVADDLNWAIGRHQVSFGGEYVRTQLNANNVYETNGVFTFSGIYSKHGPNPGTGTSIGDANLDFLTGSLNSYVQSNSQQNAMRMSVPSLYVQDTWHTSPRVVLSGGVRWDPELFPYDYFGRGAVINEQALASNQLSTRFPTAPAGMFFYGDEGVTKSFTTNRWAQFSPRVGATYDPTGTGAMVMRAGFALVYDQPNLFTAQHVGQDPPFSAAIGNNPTNQPLSLDSPWSNGSNPSNPFPLSSSSYPATLTNAQVFSLQPTFRAPYVMQWTTSVQQQLGKGWQFQLDYIGNATRQEPYPLAMNPATYVPGVWGAAGTGCTGVVTTGPNGIAPGAAGTPCSTASGKNYSARFKFTEINPIEGPRIQGGGGDLGNIGSAYIRSGANASYNGVIFTLQHRVGSFTFLANYTWSHCIDIIDNPGDISITSAGQNANNLKGDEGNCGFDFRHVFNTTVVAQSHFALDGWKAALINHWEISPLVHITSGAPFTVLAGQDNSLTDQNNDRANLVDASIVYTHKKILSGSGSPVVSTPRQYLNPAAFAQAPTGTFGNTSRFEFRGPDFIQIDANINRSFKVYKRSALNLRLECFNIPNHPALMAPGSSGYIGSATALNSKTFGQISAVSSSYPARIFQAAAKFTF